MNEVNSLLKKKKWYRRKWLYIILVAVLLVGGSVYSQYRKSKSLPQYETVTVKKGTLKQTVDATGNVQSANDLTLRFETAGKLARLYKSVNDQVKKGEILAELDLTELDANVAQAQAAVAKAEADLNKQLAGNTPEYIAGLEASLAKAKADLEQVQGSVPGVENSKIVNKAYEDALVTLQAVQNILSSSLTTADNILGVDNTLANDSFESVLSALDLGVLASAKNRYSAVKANKIDFDDLINGLNKTAEHLKFDTAVSQGEEALQEMSNLLFYVAAVLDKTTAIGSLSQTSLNTMKTDVQTARANVVAKYGELVDEGQALDSARNTYYSYQALVDKAAAALADAKNPPREVDLAAYRAALQSAEAGLAQTAANRNKARIFAPVDGLVGKVLPQVGEYVTAQSEVIKLVSQHFEIKVDIPETDIIKITLGNAAAVKLDAYGDEAVFQGQVAEIEKGETVIQDVVYYRVTVALADSTDKEIFNGMTANVVFATAQKENALYVPQRAVLTNAEKYVRVLENNQVKEVPVILGLKGDGGMVEITSGLSEGQDVVVGTTQ